MKRNFHQQIREEIDNYASDDSSMMEYGKKVTADPSESSFSVAKSTNV